MLIAITIIVLLVGFMVFLFVGPSQDHYSRFLREEEAAKQFNNEENK